MDGAPAEDTGQGSRGVKQGELVPHLLDADHSDINLALSISSWSGHNQ
jgi:hypothetical protein